MLNESEIIEEFRAAMREQGIETDDSIIADGSFHRVHVIGDRPRSRNGFYLLHIDDHPAGIFGCNKRYGNDHKFKWSSKHKSKPLTREERRDLTRRMEQRKREKAAAEAARHAEAAELANAIWNSAGECHDHPYLKRKGVKSHGLRVGRWEKVNTETGEVTLVSDNALLVPIRDKSKRIHNLQAILPNSRNILHRDKDFLSGGAKQGLFYSIGKPMAIDDGRMLIIICEGYATGATIHECTGHAVIVAFDAGNLEPVARSIRERFPDAAIMIASDNDQWTTKPVYNPGFAKAKEAAAAVDGIVAIPPFVHSEGTQAEDGSWSGPTDFNDMFKMDGAEAVLSVITSALNWQPDLDDDGDAQMPDYHYGNGGDDDDGDVTMPEDNGHFTVLGFDRDEWFVFCHQRGQVVALTKGDFTEVGLIQLAPLQWWESNFSGGKNGINRSMVAEFIMRTAERRGLYDPSRRRGRGAWIDEGRIVYHHGTHLSVGHESIPVTKIKSHYMYELGRSLPTVSEDPLSDDDGRRILEIAKRFRWKKEGSAALIAGWVVLAPFCGALRWRPHIWLRGTAGSGKSTVLNDYIYALIRGYEVFAQGNSTEAGLRQTLKCDALPVLFDESESNEENDARRMQNIISMIRQASTESEARTLKGTAGGDALSFHVRSMFCLASIQAAIKHQADAERMAVLELRPKREETDAAGSWKRLKDELYKIRRDPTIQSRLFRRTLNLLPNILLNIDTFSEVAAQRFGSQRDGDQYGTLLAGAWSLISTGIATYQQAEELIDSYDWSEHVDNTDSDEPAKALAALLESHIRVAAGIELTVYELICAASGVAAEGAGGYDMIDIKGDAILQRYGMRVLNGYLCLSNISQEIPRLMNGTPFAADLRRLLLDIPGADRNGNSTIRFNGSPAKCIRIPVAPLLHDDRGAMQPSMAFDRDPF